MLLLSSIILTGCAVLTPEPDNFVPPVPYELLQPCEQPIPWAKNKKDVVTMAGVSQSTAINWKNQKLCIVKNDAWQLWYKKLYKKD